MPELHLIVVTHTPLRLRRTLLGAACQRRRPDSVTVTCDGDDPAIGEALRDAADEFGLELVHVHRPGHEKSRPAQARNNAVRALLDAGAAPDAWLVFFDGDCVPTAGVLAAHEARRRRCDLVLGWRHDLTEDQDNAFDEDALRRGEPPVTVTDDQRRTLRRRHARLRRQAILRRVGLGKPHKPKLLGANFSLSLAMYERINGHDETFEGWAQEDDDLGRRVYMAGGRPVVAAADIVLYHQHHVTRAPPDWENSPNAPRLAEPCETVCARGLRNPIEQETPRVERIAPRARAYASSSSAK